MDQLARKALHKTPVSFNWIAYHTYRSRRPADKSVWHLELINCVLFCWTQ